MIALERAHNKKDPAEAGPVWQEVGSGILSSMCSYSTKSAEIIKITITPTAKDKITPLPEGKLR